MKDYLIAERYAKALSASIPDTVDLDAAQAVMSQLSELYTTEPSFRSALANPAINVDDRGAVLAEVVRRVDAPAPVARLTDVLLRRGRIMLLPAVAVVFATLVDERLKRATAAVTSAVALGDLQRARLRAALGKFSGKTVRLEEALDPELLGGAVAQIGGVVIDGSLRTRLEHMRQALLAEET